MVKSKITGELLESDAGDNSGTPPARGRSRKRAAGPTRGGRGRGRGGSGSRPTSPEIPLADIPLLQSEDSDVPPLMKSWAQLVES